MSQVGFFEKDITPPLGWPIDGSCFAELHTERVDDPLYLRIMTLVDDRGGRCALVTADLLYFPRDFSWRIKRWAEDALGMDGASVILNGSHTHCAPFLHPVYDPEHVAYVETLEHTVRNGIEQALRNAEPAEVRYGLLESHFGISRRRVDDNGRCADSMMYPSEKGYADPDLPVLAVYHDGGATLRGLWFSYACHPTSRRAAYFSADYPGAIVRHLKATLGEHVHAHFAQGAGGDIKPRFIDHEQGRFRAASWEEVDQLGEQVAGEIVDGLTADRFAPIDLDLACAECEFKAPFDMSRVPDVARLRELADMQEPLPGINPRHLRYWARLMLEAIHMDRLVDHHRMCVTRIRLTSDLQLIALSDEVVAEIGRMVKQMYDPQRTIVLGYSNHTEVYVPVARMLDEGGYESVHSVHYALQHNLQAAPFTRRIDSVIRDAVASLEN